jgi:hypothetical protein
MMWAPSCFRRCPTANERRHPGGGGLRRQQPGVRPCLTSVLCPCCPVAWLSRHCFVRICKQNSHSASLACVLWVWQGRVARQAKRGPLATPPINSLCFSLHVCLRYKASSARLFSRPGQHMVQGDCLLAVRRVARRVQAFTSIQGCCQLVFTSPAGLLLATLARRSSARHSCPETRPLTAASTP